MADTFTSVTNPNVPGLDQGVSFGRNIAARNNKFPVNTPASSTIATLIDPFGSGSIFTSVGTVPAQLALVGGTIVKGLGAAVAGTEYKIRVQATSADGLRDTNTVISFTAVPVLTPLALSPPISSGTPSTGTIVGATAGSTIVSNFPGLTVNSAARTYSYDGTASATLSNGMVETLDRALGTPLSSPVGALPALPLASGARVQLDGDSFVANGSFSYTPAGVLKGGFNLFARGLVSLLRSADPRFNLDVFLNLEHPYALAGNKLDGSPQGYSGGGSRDIGILPGLLTRAVYAIARKPQIVLVDIGKNEVAQGDSAASITTNLDRLVGLYTSAGIHVAIRTQSYRGTWTPNGPEEQVLIAVNAWIVAQTGRAGVKVIDARTIDGTSAMDAALLNVVDLTHWRNKGAWANLEVALPVLQTMVASGNDHLADPTSALNLSPLKGLPGNTGTKNTGITGDVATGLIALRGAGTSTYVGAKELISGTNWKQNFTITPVADATLVHQLWLRNIAAPTFAAIGLSADDWLRVFVTVELDDWAGFKLNETDGLACPVTLGVVQGNAATQTIWNVADYGSIPNRSFRLECLMQIRSEADRFVTGGSPQPLTIKHYSNVAGTGVVKISGYTFEKLAGDPRGAWNLPA